MKKNNRFQQLVAASILTVGVFSAPALACDHSFCTADGVYFKNLHNNTAVNQEFNVEMALNGMEIHKAGELIEGTGHFHILVDTDYVKKGDVVKKDATHIHFGKGQTEATLKLSPGEHTLTLQLADGHHVSYGKAWSRTVAVYVKP